VGDICVLLLFFFLKLISSFATSVVLVGVTVGSLQRIHNLQYLNEQVNDVHVQVHHSDDVLFGTQVLHCDVGVINQVRGEKAGTKDCQNCVGHTISEPHMQETADEHDHAERGQDAAQVAEILLARQCV